MTLKTDRLGDHPAVRRPKEAYLQPVSGIKNCGFLLTPNGEVLIREGDWIVEGDNGAFSLASVCPEGAIPFCEKCAAKKTKEQLMSDLADEIECAAALETVGRSGRRLPLGSPKLVVEALRAAIQPQQMRDAIELTEDMLEAGAQALADDVWHPPIKLSLMAKHEASKFRRQALIALKAATAFSRPKCGDQK